MMVNVIKLSHLTVGVAVVGLINYVPVRLSSSSEELATGYSLIK